MKSLRCINKAVNENPDMSSINQTYSDRFHSSSRGGYDTFDDPRDKEKIMIENQGVIPTRESPVDIMNNTFAHNGKKKADKSRITQESTYHEDQFTDGCSSNNHKRSPKPKEGCSDLSVISSPNIFVADDNCDETSRVTDDFRIIEDSSTEVRIKQITAYASHYIIAIEVVYIQANGVETTSVHSSNEKYLNSRPDLEKRTIELEMDEYINYLSYTISSQTGLIRTLQIETTLGNQLLVEGQVELNYLAKDSGQDSSFSSLAGAGKDDKHTFLKSYDHDLNNIDYTNNLKNASIRILSEKPSILAGREFNSKEPHQGSVLKLYEKEKALNFVKLSQRVVGFKTRFDGYLKEINLYTEPCTYHKIG